MVKIDSQALKACREAKRLTQEELARKTKMDPGTISRIERGSGQVRGRTLEWLAKYLEVAPEVLTGQSPVPEQSLDDVVEEKSQLNYRIRDGARNALQLVATRYKITPTEVIELAPFLFEWAATESLKRRQAGIDRLRSILNQVEEVRRTTIAHLNPAISEPFDTQEILRAEKASIDDRDIFGSWLEASDHIEPLIPGYGSEEDSPFVLFLKSLGEQTGGLAKFDFWDSGPVYDMCEAEALQLADGDTKIARSIVAGGIPLHEMPKDFRSAENAEARIQWLRNRHAQAMQKLAELFPEFADNLQMLGDLQ